MKEEYNIWDFGVRINIKLKPEFLLDLNFKINKQFKSKEELYLIVKTKIDIPYSTFKTRLKPSYLYFIDLDLVILLCKILNISLLEMQANILGYKSRKGVNYIDHPILPVKITPIYNMLIAHHIGDGNLIKSKDNRLWYFSYRQFNVEYKLLYLQKIESVFGKVVYKKKYFLKNNNTRIYFPVAAANLMFCVYNLDENAFYSDSALIPEQLFNKKPENMLAFLIAIIIDEGHIDSSNIVIRMKNFEFVKGLKRICEILGYNTTMVKSKDGLDTIYILSNCLKKFYNDYQRLLNNYPEVDLGIKGKLIQEIITRKNKSKKYFVGNKDKILSLINNEGKCVNQIARELNMTRQGARYLINELVKENKIQKVGIIKFGNIIYNKVK